MIWESVPTAISTHAIGAILWKAALRPWSSCATRDWSPPLAWALTNGRCVLRRCNTVTSTAFCWLDDTPCWGKVLLNSFFLCSRYAAFLYFWGGRLTRGFWQPV